MNIQIVGIPSHAGALFEGTEMAPKAIREAGLVQKLAEVGFSVDDMGDLLTSQTLPRHNISPVRNWPAPRIVWDEINERAGDIFQKDFTILLGGDCSIEVGTFQAFRKIFGQDSHLLVLDGHVDTMKPKGETCIGAAGMGLWFLLHDEKIWCKEDPISFNCVSIIGPQDITEVEEQIQIISYDQLTTSNYLSIVKDHLNSISADSILVHLDVDVLHKSIMPAAYAPSEVGLDLVKAKGILQMILADSRVKAIEVTEFSAIKDNDRESAKLIVELICLLAHRIR